jgi:hypothetical protein
MLALVRETDSPCWFAVIRFCAPVGWMSRDTLSISSKGNSSQQAVLILRLHFDETALNQPSPSRHDPSNLGTQAANADTRIQYPKIVLLRAARCFQGSYASDSLASRSRIVSYLVCDSLLPLERRAMLSEYRMIRCFSTFQNILSLLIPSTLTNTTYQYPFHQSCPIHFPSLHPQSLQGHTPTFEDHCATF